jgi:hypothetical protein
MKRQSILVLFTTTFLFFPIGSQNAEADLYFDDGEIHNIDYFINDDVWVDWDAPGMQTTVNFLDGGSMAVGSQLHGYNDSHINISGGYTYTLRVYDNTQVDITGGRAQLFYAYDDTQADIRGGIVSLFVGQDNTQVDITGGSIGHWSLSQNAYTKRSGGATMAGFLTIQESSIFTLVGSNFTVDGQAFGYGELSSINGWYPSSEPFRTLTGTLADGGSINYQFRIGHEATIVLVPAPGAVFLGIIGLSYAGWRLRRGCW